MHNCKFINNTIIMIPSLNTIEVVTLYIGLVNTGIPLGPYSVEMQHREM